MLKGSLATEENPTEPLALYLQTAHTIEGLTGDSFLNLGKMPGVDLPTLLKLAIPDIQPWFRRTFRTMPDIGNEPA